MSAITASAVENWGRADDPLRSGVGLAVLALTGRSEDETGAVGDRGPDAPVSGELPGPSGPREQPPSAKAARNATDHLANGRLAS